MSYANLRISITFAHIFQDMRIIHIFNELKFSGAEIMYVDAAPIFRQLGCELLAVSTAQNTGEYAPYFENAGYRVLHRPFPPAGKLLKRIRYCWGLIRFLREDSCDAVHIHSQRMMWTMACCARLAGIRAVYTCHNVFRPKHAYTWLYRYLSRWTARRLFRCIFHTISDSVYLNEKNYFHNKTVRINNWYGSHRFYPAGQGEKDSVRRELGIPGDAPVIITVGGCSPVKRHTDAIRALPAVVGRYPDTVYLHLGEGISLPEEQALAETLHLTAHVRFYGNRDDVRKYLIASDIYVMISTHEGSPLTVVEAMACGIPAILYDVPGLKDFNHETECALIIREDPQVLSESILSLFGDTERRQTLAAHAAAWVKARFDMKTNAGKIFELYG